MPARSVLPLVLAVIAGACGDGDAPRAAHVPADTSAAAPAIVPLTAGEYAVTLPDTIAAGWTTFRLTNVGREVHYGHIVRLDPGRTVDELAAAYLEAIRTSAPRPAWVKRFGGPGAAGPGGSANATQWLEPGEYVWICPVEDEQGMPHFARGEVKPFVVRAAGGDASSGGSRGAEPPAEAVIRLVDHAFAVDSTLRAGRRTIRVENAGAQPHDVSLMKLAPGVTIEDLQAWLNPERARRDDAESPPPFASMGSGAGGIAAIAPGMRAWFETELTPGTYVLFCMVTAPDGRSHIEHGMIRRIQVD